MVSKKILGVAIAAAFSSQAFAVIDLTGGTGGAGSGAVVYAKETITTAQVVSSMVQATAATTELNIQVAAGFGVVATNHVYVRFNLVNAKFLSAVTGGSLTGLTANSVASASVSQGGAAGDDFVIFDITAGSAGLGQADKLQLALTNLQVSPTSPASVYYTLFNLANASQAVAATGATTTGSLANDNYAFASVANALTATISKTDRIADVNATTAFTTFVSPASATAALGKVNFTLTAGTLTAAGGAVTALNQLIDVADGKSALSVTGDLSYTVGANAAATAANLTFGAQVSNTAATNVASAKTDKFTTAAFAVNTDYNVSVTAVSAINAGAYSLTFTPTAITNAAYGAATTSGSLGTITRNGATIQVPYLTTNAGLNQKVVLVNRGSSDTTYSTSFTTENGVTAAAGSKASGTLKAKETLVIKAADLVTLTNGTRTAATITALAPASTIDAATQTVVTDSASVSFGSNDTVNLDVK